nr:hypothetical protein [Marinicella sp. W31]MDC2878223.1 hypothetical protein [Marinicella sp. W31]
MSLVFPISPLAGSEYLSIAFIVCVLGGLGSIAGAIVGGSRSALSRVSARCSSAPNTA